MGRITLKDDWAEFRTGLFAAVNNVWNKGGLQNGAGYSQSISVDSKLFPNATTLSWAWPDAFNPSIYSYPELVVGDKAWNDYGITDLTSKIADLRDFRIKYDLSIAGETENFNVAFNLWLTDRPKGTAADITTEVMVWVHAGKLNPAGSATGKYDGAGFDAAVYSNPDHGDASGQNGQGWEYVALKSEGDDLKGEIDVRDILLSLRKEGLVSGGEYVMGYELGAEVAAGKGSLTVEALSQSFSKYRITNKADKLSGTGLNDSIDAKGGDDRLTGGKGADALRGGSGKDTFVFAKLSDSTAKGYGRDTIYDFAKGDRFDLGAIDASAKKSGNQAFSFIGADKFDGKAGELRYEKKSSDTYVYADVNGDKQADFGFRLDDAVKLAKADFLL